MSSLLRLPQEVRNVIYEDCLGYLTEYVPFPTETERNFIRSCGNQPPNKGTILPVGALQKLDATYSHPNQCITLLGVNRTINQEAAEIIFAKSVWRFSMPSQEHLGPFEKQFWQRYTPFFRRVMTTFSMTDVPNTERLRQGLTYSAPQWAHLTREERRAAIHDSLYSQQIQPWVSKLTVIAQMDLRALLIDLRELMCPQGCCRMDTLLGLLYQCFASTEVELKIRNQHLRVQKNGLFAQEDMGFGIEFRTDSDKLIVITELKSRKERDGALQYLQAIREARGWGTTID